MVIEMKIEFDLGEELISKAIRNTIEYQIRFYFPNVSSITWINKKLIIESAEELEEENVKMHINSILSKYPYKKKKFNKKIFFNSNDNKFIDTNENMLLILNRFINTMKSKVDNLDKLLIKDCDLFEGNEKIKLSKGLNIYTRRLPALMEFIDDIFKDLFKNLFGAVEIIAPSIISTDIIDKCGYFVTGCQHISFVSPITNHPDRFKEFLPAWEKNKKDKEKSFSIHHYCKEPTYILNPALCLHCYPIFQNKKISKDNLIAVTIKGNCFRDEFGNLNNEERLYEFIMRECVFFGGNKIILKTHKLLLELLKLLGYVFGINFKLETSNDIFFDENAQNLLFAQLVSDNKVEMTTYVKSLNKEISIASINKHENHFSKAFNIRDEEDGILSTMCIGIGYNRFIMPIQEQIDEYGEDYIKKIRANLDRIS